MLSEVTYGFLLGLPLLYLLLRPSLSPSPQSQPPIAEEKKSLKTIMQAPRDDLAPPKDDPFTLNQLKEFDGSDLSKPIYVSIKGASSCYEATIVVRSLLAGIVFDVTRKKDVYGPGKGYNIFAGKDGSKGLGKSSLSLEDAVPDYSDLPENERKVLDDWFSFFQYVRLEQTCPSAYCSFPT
jgi:membrane-associated progesterone receptor component